MSSAIHRSNIEIRPCVKRSLTIAWVVNNEKLKKGSSQKVVAVTYERLLRIWRLGWENFGVLHKWEVTENEYEF